MFSFEEKFPRYLLTVISVAGWWDDVEIEADSLLEIDKSLQRFKEENSGEFTGAILEDLEIGTVIGEYPF